MRVNLNGQISIEYDQKSQMEQPYKPRNILRLPGVSAKDHVPIEDVADSRLIEQPDESEIDIILLDKIPRVFTGLDKWPTSTNLKCHECCMNHDMVPIFVPTYIVELHGEIEIGVKGSYCTFNCAELWIEKTYASQPEMLWRAQDNLRTLYFIFTGRRISRIAPAIDKTELKIYGGELDENDFWRMMRELDPISGLRNHTLGSIVPERERTITDKKVKVRVEPSSIWEICSFRSHFPKPDCVPRAAAQPHTALDAHATAQPVNVDHHPEDAALDAQDANVALDVASNAHPEADECELTLDDIYDLF